MTAHRTIVYRLLPETRANARLLMGQAGACRYVWNALLAESGDQYREWEEAREAGINDFEKPSVSFFSLGKRFTKLRREVDWLDQYSFKITRYALKYQADAWKAAFGNGRGFPRFHSRHGRDPSFTVPDRVMIRDGKLYLPCIGWLPIRRRGGNPHPEGVPVRAVVKRQAGKWYVSVCYRVELPEIEDNGEVVGIDRNVGNIAYATGKGDAGLIASPDLSRDDSLVRKASRKLSRQKRGSRRRQRHVLYLRKLHRRRANRRSDWQHKASRGIASMASTVVVEDLNIRGMSKSARGTVDNPGRHVKAKSGLNREILNMGWHGLVQRMSYKCREVIMVNPAHTSQTCSECGEVDGRSRRGRGFKCVACGHADHADLNAARNILASGIGAAAHGGILDGLPALSATEAMPLKCEMDTKVALST